MRVVDQSRGPGLNGLQGARELAPEQILDGPEDRAGVASGQILDEGLVGVRSLVLRLPEVSMGVDEAGADNLASAVDDLDVGANVDFLGDPRDELPFNQEVCLCGYDVVVGVMKEQDTATQQHLRCRHVEILHTMI